MKQPGCGSIRREVGPEHQPTTPVPYQQEQRRVGSRRQQQRGHRPAAAVRNELLRRVPVPVAAVKRWDKLLGLYPDLMRKCSPSTVWSPVAISSCLPRRWLSTTARSNHFLKIESARFPYRTMMHSRQHIHTCGEVETWPPQEESVQCERSFV